MNLTILKRWVCPMRLIGVMAGLVVAVQGGCSSEPGVAKGFCSSGPSVATMRRTLPGRWKQVWSSKYIATTRLIDADCVRVGVAVDTDDTVHIDQTLILHHRSNLTEHHQYTLRGMNITTGMIEFQDRTHDLAYQLRCIEEDPDVAIWTATDNLTMMVWTRDIHEFPAARVDEYLSTILYNVSYKQPVVTYHAQLCDR